MKRPDPKDPIATESDRKPIILTKNSVSPVPAIDGKAKSGKNKAKPT